MKKLITIIGCALAAQVTYADDYETYVAQLNLQKIADQGKRVVELLEKQNVQPGYGSLSPAQIEAEYRKLDEARAARAAAIAKTLPPLVLPSNGLDYEVLEKLPPGTVIHLPKGDVVVPK